jgi:drug/metabolite transporter (DMT)-like permease
MTGVALLLVLASAACHASWNFLLKRSEHKVAFLGSAGIVAALTLLLPAISVVAVNGIGSSAVALGCVTGCLHGIYGLSLARGYRLGDLSSVYPISRGVGLALIPLGAAVLLDESISGWAVVGIAMIAAGVYALHVEPETWRDVAAPLRALNGPAGRAALLTGVLIATYSLWDKHALEELSPVVLNQFAMTGHALITTTVAIAAVRSLDDLRWEWRSRAGSIIVAGFLIQLAYLLVLAALETSRVSYVAPSREVGIVFGAALGVAFLGEGFGLWRIWASLVIVAGVVVLAIAP